MTDFLTSLAARNLGPLPETSAPESENVRPRPVGVFEAEGSAEQAFEKLPDDTVQSDPPSEAPVLIAPDQPPASEPSDLKNPILTAPPSSFVEDTRPPATSALEPAPEESVTPEAVPETPQTEQTSDPDIDVAEVQDPLPSRNETALPAGPETILGKLPQPQAIEVQHTDISEPLESQGKSTPTPKLTLEPARQPQPAKKNVGALERIVRQMVLNPMPEISPVPQQPGPAKADMEPVSDIPKEFSERNPEPGADHIELVLSPVPEPIETVSLRPEAPAHESAPPLAPVSDQPVPIEAEPAKTIVRINIGRIEVNALAAEQPTDEPGPARPEPALMSLDEYLEMRNSGGAG